MRHVWVVERFNAGWRVLLAGYDPSCNREWARHAARVERKFGFSVRVRKYVPEVR